MGDSIRVAEIVEADRTFVLEMPLTFDTRRTRHAVKDGQGRYLELIDSYENRLGNGLELVKNEISTLLGNSSNVQIQKKLKNLRLLRNTSLRAVIAILESMDRSDDEDKALAKLYSWADKDARLTRSLNDAFYRFTSRRRWWYQNLAAQLCEKYSRIELNSLDLDGVAQAADSDINELAGDKKAQEYAKRLSARYRSAAGLSEFKLWLKNAARKGGTVIVDPDEERRKSRKTTRKANRSEVFDNIETAAVVA